MAKKSIVINGMSFTSIKKIEDYVRSRLESNESKGEISLHDHDWDFFCSLIERHPQFSSKRGSGVSKFLIKRSFRNHIELHLLRIDGAQIDISWTTCASGKGNTPLQNLKEAMRVAIEKQIDDYRSVNFQKGMACDICSLAISEVRDSQVDHVVHFEELVEAFFVLNSAPLPDTFDDEIVTNCAKFKEVDRMFSQAWMEFHFSQAKLRVVHTKCNLSRKKAL